MNSPSDQAYGPMGDALAFEDMPLERDMFLLGENQAADLQREWQRYLADPDGTTPDHPNVFLNPRWCAIDAIGHDSCAVNICVTRIHRYHGVVRTLPRSMFRACIHYWNYEKRAYLIVAQDWLDDIEQALFSMYALVDVIGMRKLLERQGRLEASQVEAIKSGMDAVAFRRPDFTFLTLADNVVVKSNWSAGGADYDRTYQPESFLAVVDDVRTVLRNSLSLESYAVVSQGANAFSSDAVPGGSEQRNHLFFASLGAPFAELIEIESAVRSALRRGVHAPCDLYLSDRFFVTLHFRHYSARDYLLGKMMAFDFKMVQPGRASYLPIDRADLLGLMNQDAPSVPGSRDAD